LFKTIAWKHILITDVLTKLRLLDRSDTAWNNGRYGAVWYGMRSEFDFDERFEALEFKLKLIEQNAKFFVEVLQSQKSSTLEWIIVVLIFVECIIMTADMTGMGELFVGFLRDMWEPTVAAADAMSLGTEGAPSSASVADPGSMLPSTATDRTGATNP
jgi:hypothetical protein